MGFPMTERCLDCGGLRSEPGAPAICAGWHHPTPADDEDAIHEAGVGYHAPGPYGYGSSHRAEARPSNFTPDEIDAIDEALRDAGLDNDTDIRSRVRTVLETTSEIDKHTVDRLAEAIDEHFDHCLRSHRDPEGVREFAEILASRLAEKAIADYHAPEGLQPTDGLCCRHGVIHRWEAVPNGEL